MRVVWLGLLWAWGEVAGFATHDGRGVVVWADEWGCVVHRRAVGCGPVVRDLSEDTLDVDLRACAVRLVGGGAPWTGTVVDHSLAHPAGRRLSEAETPEESWHDVAAGSGW